MDAWPWQKGMPFPEKGAPGLGLFVSEANRLHPFIFTLPT